MAALLLLARPLLAADHAFQRANIVGCAKAVDVLGDGLRAPMQTHCLAIAIAQCEAPDSGPAAACFADLEATMRRYAEQLEPLLGVIVPRDASDTLCASRFASDTNRTRCTLVAEFGHLRDLFGAARDEGVALP